MTEGQIHYILFLLWSIIIFNVGCYVGQRSKHD